MRGDLEIKTNLQRLLAVRDDQVYQACQHIKILHIQPNS